MRALILGILFILGLTAHAEFFGTGGFAGGGFSASGFNPYGMEGLTTTYHFAAAQVTNDTPGVSDLISEIRPANSSGVTLTSTNTTRFTWKAGGSCNKGQLPCLRSDGGDYATGTGGFPTGSYTQCAIYNPASFTTTQVYVGSDGTSTSTHALYNDTQGDAIANHYNGFQTPEPADNSIRVGTALNHFACAFYDATNNVGFLMVDGRVSGYDTSVTSDNVEADMRLGAWYDASLPMRSGSELVYVGVWNRILTKPEVKALETFFAPAAMADLTQLRNFTDLIVCLGDSLTSGTGSSGGNTYPAQLDSLLASSNDQVINSGVAGETIDQIKDRAVGASGAHNFPGPAYGEKILVLWAGSNDTAQTAAAMYSDLLDAVTSANTNGGYDKIYVITGIPREDATKTAKLFAFNDLLRANTSALQAVGMTALIDVQARAMFDDDNDFDDTTYYHTDKIHLNNTGYGEIADAVRDAL